LSYILKIEMIKICYDYHAFSALKYGGISRYLYEVATRIKLDGRDDIRVAAGFYVNEYLRRCPSGLVAGLPIPLIDKPTFLYHRVERLKSFANDRFCQYYCSRFNPDIVHETYYSPKRLASPKSKIVLTVYDMIHEKFCHTLPDFMTQGCSDFIEVKYNAIQRADHIICISETTKHDLIQFTGVSPDKVSTVYLGYSLDTYKTLSTASPRLIAEPYLLYVGERRPLYKNIKRLIEAYASSLVLRTQFKLVLCGSQPLSRIEIDLMIQLGLGDRQVFQVKASDQTLASLYTYASAFVYPSLYEGFGIPPLEAMSFGCPVVCSQEGSVPEILGDSAEYFDPYQVESIVAALEKVVLSQERSGDLTQLGYQCIQNYSWDKCARETQRVYHTLCE